ncbi:hypothetical protein BJ878DRAFT_477983 [Calycina marina]|uniref:Uncharacterized protein n=1 Tax=Calycina marina TaxID=1763456 RepID=A0A9P8CHD9_9HELO|nr:hypothetical protein BJ878DRAFT_477983 [Calycina marina]
MAVFNDSSSPSFHHIDLATNESSLIQLLVATSFQHGPTDFPPRSRQRTHLLLRSPHLVVPHQRQNRLPSRLKDHGYRKVPPRLRQAQGPRAARLSHRRRAQTSRGVSARRRIGRRQAGVLAKKEGLVCEPARLKEKRMEANMENGEALTKEMLKDTPAGMAMQVKLMEMIYDEGRLENPLPLDITEGRRRLVSAYSLGFHTSGF